MELDGINIGNGNRLGRNIADIKSLFFVENSSIMLSFDFGIF